MKPHLGRFGYIKGTVPIKDGKVRVYLSKDKISVTATKPGGTLIWDGMAYKLEVNKEISISKEK